MNREIKFRGKRIDNGEWIFGDLFQSVTYNSTGEKTFFPAILYWDEGFVSPPVDPETVGQYTGLKDKNGNEIYEGDIVKWHWAHDDNRESPETAIITYSVDRYAGVGFVFPKTQYDVIDENIEIIGNIFDPTSQQNKA